MKAASIKLLGVLSLLMVITLFSCDNETEFEKQVKDDEQKIEDFLNRNSISAEKHSSGIYYEALETNASGEDVQDGDVVSFYYKLSTLDSTYEEVMSDSLHPVVTEQNYNRIIPTGIYDGLSLMKKEEKYRFFIPSYLAYNNYGDPDFFNARAIFIVDIEVVDIQSKDDVNELELDSIDSYIENNAIDEIESFSSGLYYKTLEPGDGDHPSPNTYVKFHFKRKYLDGTVIYETPQDEPVETWLSEDYMVKGLVEGIGKMEPGEKAMFIMPSKLAFGSSIQVLPQGIRETLVEDNVLINASVLPFTPVIYEVELLGNN